MEKVLCYNCFHKIDPGMQVCPFCGSAAKDNLEEHPQALQCGSVIGGRYIIGRVLGQGGFGITYAALDYGSGEKVAIKEYYPDSLVSRAARGSVMPFRGRDDSEYAYGRSMFLNEAKTLAEFNNINGIVHVYSYFEENNTAYFAMEYVDGISLKEYIGRAGGRISFEEAKRILIPVMDALAQVHAKGIIHRDIKPDNIYITSKGEIRILDFGSARYSMGEKSRSIDVILTHGFAPREQYSRHGRQGAYTDVYALGATFYYAITGRTPQDSIDRLDDDLLALPSRLGARVTGAEEDVIMQALSVDAQDRYQNMLRFKMALLALPGNAPEIPAPPNAPVPANTPVPASTPTPANAPVPVSNPAPANTPAPASTPVPVSTPDTVRQDGSAGAKRQAPAARKSREQDGPKIREQGSPKARGQADPKPKKKVPVFVWLLIGLAAVPIIAFVVLLPGLREGFDKNASPVSRTKVGSYVTFGSYEQDNDTSNGKEEIEWLVLAKDGDRMLVISRYALDCQPFNYSYEVTWEDSSLRTWLNEAFFRDAFSAGEQAMIQNTKVIAEDNPYSGTFGGNDTEDRVFLLSLAEANGYFSSDRTRKCTATDYAAAHGIKKDGSGPADGGAACRWWLRTPSYNNDLMTGVTESGYVMDDSDDFGVCRKDIGVRPALWIDFGIQ